jgi:hypothetical protein
MSEFIRNLDVSLEIVSPAGIDFLLLHKKKEVTTDDEDRTLNYFFL